jgi:hypothetical protein
MFETERELSQNKTQHTDHATHGSIFHTSWDYSAATVIHSDSSPTLHVRKPRLSRYRLTLKVDA